MKEINPLQIGDIVDDLKCIGIAQTTIHEARTKCYVMKCIKCGRTKQMLSSTIRKRHGTTHKACGKGIKTKDPIFHSRWCAMRTRTTNPKYHAKNSYMDKNITSDEFEYFIDFYDAMYESYKKLADIIGPENTSLERIDNSKSYSKDNCIWIHKKEQPKNTTRIVKFIVTFPDGHKEIHQNVCEFAKKHNLNVSAVHDCMNPKRSATRHKNYKFERL